jgi:hypothetical protein
MESRAYSKKQGSVLGKWVGIYGCAGVLGKTIGSTPMTVDITLTLKPDGDCRIGSVGYMKREHILC